MQATAITMPHANPNMPIMPRKIPIHWRIEKIAKPCLYGYGVVFRWNMMYSQRLTQKNTSTRYAAWLMERVMVNPLADLTDERVDSFCDCSACAVLDATHRVVDCTSVHLTVWPNLGSLPSK